MNNRKNLQKHDSCGSNCKMPSDFKTAINADGQKPALEATSQTLRLATETSCPCPKIY